MRGESGGPYLSVRMRVSGKIRSGSRDPAIYTCTHVHEVYIACAVCILHEKSSHYCMIS